MDIENKNKENLIYSHISKYTKPNDYTATCNLLTTLLLYSFLLTCHNFLIVPIFAFTIIRTFIIFHDLAHYNYFSNNYANFIIGTLIGPLTFTPLSYWKYGHDYHHKNSNKLDKLQYAQSAPFSLRNYKTLSTYGKLAYYVIFSGKTFFTITPLLYFLIVQQIYSKWYEKILQILFWIFLYKLDKFYYLLLSYTLAGFIGFALFHLHHTFDGVYRKRSEEWEYLKNGLYGASYLIIPENIILNKFFKFMFLGIEYHHIHHINSKVPGYNLEKCHNDGKELFKDVKKVHFTDFLKTWNYSLYDEDTKTFVSI
jgi:omega-6 fatty acid desaturase (delta-12 desaturase)